jgi:hypothetical protein
MYSDLELRVSAIAFALTLLIAVLGKWLNSKRLQHLGGWLVLLLFSSFPAISIFNLIQAIADPTITFHTLDRPEGHFIHPITFSLNGSPVLFSLMALLTLMSCGWFTYFAWQILAKLRETGT